MFAPKSQRSRLLSSLLILLLACSYSNAQDLVINEIHYEPEDDTSASEFIEIYNNGGEVDLSDCFFSAGIQYDFPADSSIASGQYLILAQDPAAFRTEFGFDPDLGPYEGRLSNGGERLALRDPTGALLDEVSYRVEFPWPLAPAGKGSSMELIDPSLDNDLGGAWRSSGYNSGGPEPEEPIVYLGSQSSDWLYRKGTSNPPANWRDVDFVENGDWIQARTSIGYGDGDDNTTLTDMSGGYSSIYLRHEFEIESNEGIASDVRLRVYVDDGCVVWINGTEVGRFFVDGGNLDFDDTGINHEASWEELDLDTDGILRVGTNVIAIHALNQSRTSSDFSIDASLATPVAAANEFGPPTPGAANSVFEANAPPILRQVRHTPLQPESGTPIPVSVKVSDAQGVDSVTLLYQIVRPGQFIPAFYPLPHGTLLSDPDREFESNPDFENPANWVEVEMLDDGQGFDALAGDEIYSATIPAQGNRTLVRYRISATDVIGRSVRVPYRDDPSLNFALWVYDGVPEFEAATRTVQAGGPPYTYPREVMTALPVYSLVTRAADMTQCIGYSGTQIPKSNEDARDRFNWEGAFVYEGYVYDHVNYRLRQANDRYGGSGKRSMRIRFRRGNRLRARDNYGKRYPRRWRTLNTGKMFDNKRVGNFGLTEKMNHDMWSLMGVPAPFIHTFHFRVVDGADEAPSGQNGQHFGDFWGMQLAFQDYDTQFLDSHSLEDGNLYKLKDGQFDGNELRRHQGFLATTTDADFQNIRRNLRPTQNEAWLDAHVNYDRWYSYHAVVEGIRHYDFRPADSHSKNRAWYFEPGGSQFGRLWTLPWDSDASWGPNWNSGEDYSKAAIFNNGGKPRFKQAYRNRLREFRDIVWTREVIETAIDDLAGFVRDFSSADRDRWRSAPSSAGSQDFGPINSKISDMKRFAFVGWSGGSGPTVPAGGRAQHLDNLANAEGDGQNIPSFPSVSYEGPGDRDAAPLDELAFRCSQYQDTQGAASFQAMRWRVAEVTPDGTDFDPTEPRLWEWNTTWESGDLDVFDRDVTIPAGSLAIGKTYRIRVKHQDNTDRWSHWSNPIEFTVAAPTVQPPELASLRISEVMYNPFGGSDFEFIEIQNVSGTTIDLADVSLVDGVEFSFADGDVTNLLAGEYVVVVGDLRAFQSRYDTSGMHIAGEFSGQLDNGGEQLTLSFGQNLAIQSFTYDDAWYPQTDGLGFSLDLDDPSASPAVWSQQSGWNQSELQFGSPGTPPSGVPEDGGFQKPGDINQDSTVDISDAIAHLRTLFVGGVSLPCEGELGDVGNATVLDINADDQANIADAAYLLEYLFRAGPGPAHGSTCVRLEGCASICVR